MSEDQLCHQVDVNQFKDEVDVNKAAEYGLIFLVDYNEKKNPIGKYDDFRFGVSDSSYSLQNGHAKSLEATIHLETIPRNQL